MKKKFMLFLLMVIGGGYIFAGTSQFSTSEIDNRLIQVRVNQTNINILTSNLTVEAQTRQTQDGLLQSNITAEAEARAAAVSSVGSNLVTETEARQTATGLVQTNLDTHISNINNPHSVNKIQVGLGNVDDTSDLNKPVSTATQTALESKASLQSLAVAEVDIQTLGDIQNSYVTVMGAKLPFNSIGIDGRADYIGSDGEYFYSVYYNDGWKIEEAEAGVFSTNSSASKIVPTEGWSANGLSFTPGSVSLEEAARNDAVSNLWPAVSNRVASIVYTTNSVGSSYITNGVLYLGTNVPAGSIGSRRISFGGNVVYLSSTAYMNVSPLGSEFFGFLHNAASDSHFLATPLGVTNITVGLIFGYTDQTNQGCRVRLKYKTVMPNSKIRESDLYYNWAFSATNGWNGSTTNSVVYISASIPTNHFGERGGQLTVWTYTPSGGGITTYPTNGLWFIAHEADVAPGY